MTSSSGANVTTVISKIKEIQKSGALLSSLQTGVPSLSLQSVGVPIGKSSMSFDAFCISYLFRLSIMQLAFTSISYIYFSSVVEVAASSTVFSTNPTPAPKRADPNLKYLGFLAFLVVPCGCGAYFLTKRKAIN